MSTTMIERDFPKSLPEYLVRQRWPEEFRCECGSASARLLSTRAISVCHECRRHRSVTSGTAFHGTRKGLKTWLLAPCLMVSSKQGLSAKELQRQLGFKSYETAWSWLQKLRRRMVASDRSPLSGDVEVDETCVGGPQEGERGRGADGKAVVACAVEKTARGMGRVRLTVVENCSKEGTDVREMEANLFAAELLMPEVRLRCDLEELDELHLDPELPSHGRHRRPRVFAVAAVHQGLREPRGPFEVP